MNSLRFGSPPAEICGDLRKSQRQNLLVALRFREGRDYHARCPDLRRARHRWRARPRPRPRLHPPGMAASSMPFSAVNWPIIASFKACETRVARESEFEDFTTLLVICPDDSTRIELNPQPTAPLPQGGFGMSLTMMSHFCSHCFYDFGNWSRTS